MCFFFTFLYIRLSNEIASTRQKEKVREICVSLHSFSLTSPSLSLSFVRIYSKHSLYADSVNKYATIMSRCVVQKKTLWLSFNYRRCVCVCAECKLRLCVCVCVRESREKENENHLVWMACAFWNQRKKHTNKANVETSNATHERVFESYIEQKTSYWLWYIDHARALAQTTEMLILLCRKEIKRKKCHQQVKIYRV